MPIFIIAIALLVLACGQQPAASPQPSLGEQVPLLTGRLVGKEGVDTGCYLNHMDGVLTVDETYGTKMSYAEVTSSDYHPMPLMWPVGYTGHRVGSQVAVVDEHGTVVAITGNRYTIRPGAANLYKIEPPVPNAFLVCGPPAPVPPASPGG
jgi:hypothetical protein